MRWELVWKEFWFAKFRKAQQELEETEERAKMAEAKLTVVNY